MHNKLACFSFVGLAHRLLPPLHVFASLVVCLIRDDISRLISHVALWLEWENDCQFNKREETGDRVPIAPKHGDLDIILD
jgi:hypothetical protein